LGATLNRFGCSVSAYMNTAGGAIGTEPRTEPRPRTERDFERSRDREGAVDIALLLSGIRDCAGRERARAFHHWE
jgi:hypothetical protein